MDGDILHHGATKAGAMFDPATLLRLASATARPAAEARGVVLDLAVLPGTPPGLVGDVGAVGSMVNALLLSAIERSAGCVVALRLSTQSGAAGPGKPEATQLRISLTGGFEVADSFCLDLARRFVAPLGARLTLEPSGSGGAAVVLDLPVGLPGRMTDAERLMSWARTRGGRLLVVDDSATNRMVTAGLLSKVGFSVEMATGGAEAVAAIAQANVPPEAVLMDVAMPDVDGIAATETIRSLSGERGRIPIIAVTANAHPDDRSRCLAAGMNDYVTKPVRRADLLAALERWLTPS
ncbi:response regulator [Azospirillum griseum]|uniref:Response regulator n=1 Tax=Azospirillum griseum TaxID=2496639 RepID=A0A3S0L0B4_9PROT|nr:response regulator [Azospirillum griseum]RTR22905.1 response regulator [Azospirillum griseum]